MNGTGEMMETCVTIIIIITGTEINVIQKIAVKAQSSSLQLPCHNNYWGTSS